MRNSRKIWGSAGLLDEVAVIGSDPGGLSPGVPANSERAVMLWSSGGTTGFLAAYTQDLITGGATPVFYEIPLPGDSATISSLQLSWANKNKLWACGRGGLYYSENWQDGASISWTKKVAYATIATLLGYDPDYGGGTGILDFRVSHVNDGVGYMFCGDSTNAHVLESTDGWDNYTVVASKPAERIETGASRASCLSIPYQDDSICYFGTRGSVWRIDRDTPAVTQVDTSGVFYSLVPFALQYNNSSGLKHLWTSSVAVLQANLAGSSVASNINGTAFQRGPNSFAQCVGDGKLFFFDETSRDVYESTDEGLNWSTLGDLTSTYDGGVFVSPASSNVLVRMTRAVHVGAVESLRVSTNKGSTWTQITSTSLDDIKPAATDDNSGRDGDLIFY